MDPAGIGKYGCLKVLKKKTNEFAACFPIDEEEVTFGRNPECGVRLYYPTVSMFHCKIMFSDGHAFLVVMGANGVQVDGTKVFPSMSDNSVAVPLEDGSIIEIQKKRFEYNYPPKNYRAQAIIDSPMNVRRRSLRMSMIEAAQVYTPNPPRVMGAQQGPSNEMADLVALMVDGDAENSVVIENEKDVIVLEHVEDVNDDHEVQRLEQLPPAPLISKSPSTPVRLASPMYTPVNKPSPKAGRMTNGRRRSEPSLHKAVLLRSAQRAMQERQREEMEEMEVELVVSPVHFSENDENDGADGTIGPVADIPDEDGEDEDGDLTYTPSRPIKGALRKSFEAVKGMLPFNWSSSPTPEAEVKQTREDEQEDELPQIPPASDSEPSDDSDPNEGEEEEEDDEIAEIQVVERNILSTKTRALGPFMTPQRVQPNHAPRTSMPAVVSLKGGARRVPIVEVPSAFPEISQSPGKRGPQRVPIEPTPTPASAHTVEFHDPAASEDEKQRIREKRKSFNPEMFGQLPKMADWSSRQSLSPAKRIQPPVQSAEESDVNTLLTRLQAQTTEMKRKSMARQSMSRRSMSPVKAEHALPATAPLLPPKFFKEVKAELRATPPPAAPSAPPEIRNTPSVPIIRPPSSPSPTPRRKLPDLPSLPALDFGTLPTLFKPQRQRPLVPQTPAIKSVRNLFKVTESQPTLESPMVQAAGEFIHKLEDAYVAEESEVEDIIESGTCGNHADLLAEEYAVEQELSKKPGKKQVGGTSPVKPSEEPVQTGRTRPPSRNRTRKDIAHESELTEQGSRIPAKTRARRVPRSAELTTEDETTVPLSPPKVRGRGRSARKNTSDNSGSLVKEETIDTEVPLTKAKKATTRPRGKVAAAPKEELTEDDELDCLSPVKEIRALRSRGAINQASNTRKSKSTKSDTEVSEMSEQPKAKQPKRSATTGKAVGRKTRSKLADTESEDLADKENSPAQATRTSKVPARRVQKVIKEVAVEEVADAPRMTRTRARRLK